MEQRSIRWGGMLCLLVGAFLLEPLAGSSTFIDIASLALFELTIVGAVFLSVDNNTVRTLGFGLAVLWFALSIAAIFGVNMNGAVAWLSIVLVIGALFATFRILMRRGQSDVETLLGAIFGYFLLAMAWAMLFVHIERWKPGSFSVPEGSDVLSSMFYYSLVTLTTLGYGDVLPVTPIARIAAGFEAVIGVLYIAVMVGSIVGNFKSSRHD